MVDITEVTLKDGDLEDIDYLVEDNGSNKVAFYHAMTGGPTRVMMEITRPSNTTPYSAYDCVAASSPSITTQCILAGRLNGKGGKIKRVDVLTDLTTWTSALTVVLYDDVPTSFIADNSAYPGRAYADAPGIIGIVNTGAFAPDITAGTAACATVATELNYQCATTSKKVYFELFLGNVTPTPASGQKFTVVLHVDQN
jgi:hypothetical protein